MHILMVLVARLLNQLIRFPQLCVLLYIKIRVNQTSCIIGILQVPLILI